jgi:hypothetical protein
LNDRNEFEIVTEDARITASGDPQGDGTDFEFKGPSQFEPARGTYHFSFYGNRRYEDFHLSEGWSPMTHMKTAEMQLIKAEGLLRLFGPSQQVADIINATRQARGQLSPAVGSEPQSDLMDKLIYEKRIEGFLLCNGCAFFDRRGLGPLAPTGPDFHHGMVEGTPLHFPVPGVELERLGLPYYTFGGPGMEMAEGALAVARENRVPASAVYRFALDMTGSEIVALLEEQLTANRRQGMLQLMRH